MYGDREMHKAVCADCKQECEVPFKPDGNRPVYCRECFSKRRPPRRYQIDLKTSQGSSFSLNFYILDFRVFESFASKYCSIHNLPIHNIPFFEDRLKESAKVRQLGSKL